MAILLNVCKPDNTESNDSLNFSFKNNLGLHSNFVECEFFLEANSPDILALCEANLDDSVDYGNVCVRDYLALIREDSITHRNGFVVYVKELLPFSQDVSLENSVDS